MLSQHTDQTEKPSRASHLASIGAQITLGAIGLGAGALYIGPAGVCADSATCGKWLANLTSQDAAVGIFASGGLDFSAINAYFSAKSVQSFIEYIGKQKSVKAKIGKGSMVLIYAVSQNTGLLLMSLATSTAPWQTILTVAGGAPGALYGAVGMMENEIPYLLSLLNQRTKAMHYAVLSCFNPLSEEQLRYRERMAYYSRAQANLLTQLNANWNRITSRAADLPYEGEKNPLSFLMTQHAPVETPSLLYRAMYGVSVFTGVSLTGLLSAVFTAGMIPVLDSYLPSMPLQILAATFLSSSSIYGNWKIIGKGMMNLADSTYHLLSGHGINSLAFQLRPKTSTIATLLCLSSSLLSYAVINLVYENIFDSNAYEHHTYEGGRYVSILAMDFYHLAGLFHFYQLMLSKLSRDEKEQFLFQMEQEVERFNRMTLEEFIEFVENSAENSQIFGIKPHTYEADETERLLSGAAPELVINTDLSTNPSSFFYGGTEKSSFTNTPSNTRTFNA